MSRGIGDYIELAKRVRKQAPEIRFLLAGPVIPEDQGGFPAEKIAVAEAEGHIRFIGMLEDVRPVLAGRTLGCLLTRYKEGIPRSMIEFLAVGRPILVSNFDGAEDLVPDPGIGRIVNLSESSWLETASEFVQEVAANSLTYTRICAEAHRLAKLRFDGNVGIEEYLIHVSDMLHKDT